MCHSGWVWSLCIFMAAVSTGCGSSGPKLYPASGTVTYEGKPVDGATVMFTPQGGRPSIGTTDAAGKFTISTNGKPGAAPGAYTVSIIKSQIADSAVASSQAEVKPSEEEMMKRQKDMAAMMQGAQKAAKPKPLLPEKYSLPQSSSLSATVTEDASKNVFEFALTP